MKPPIFTLCALLIGATNAPAQNLPKKNLPNPRAAKDLPAAPAPGNAPGDLKSGPNTTIARRGDALSVASTGNDPLIYSGPLPGGMRGPYFIEFRMNSNALQPMEIYWKTATSGDFSGANKITMGKVGEKFDGKYRGYLLELPESVVEPLTQIRFDPASGPGESLFEFIRIRSMTGKNYWEWKAGN